MQKKFDFEIVKSDLERMYLVEFKSIKTIAEELSVSRNTIHKSLKRLNIPIRTPTHRRVSKIDKYKDDIINWYSDEGLSTIKIGKKIGFSPSAIHLKLSDWGVITRPVSENNKTVFKEDVFDSIDDEMKAYWFGFICADGYITGDYVGIALGIVDIEHLNKFKDFIQYPFDVRIYDNSKYGDSYSNGKYCRILFKSTHMVNSLIKTGCMYNKSLKFRFPEKGKIPNDLIRHFLRGYFDGDGTITFTKKSRHFKLSGTHNFLKSVIEFANESIDSHEYIFKTYKRHNNDLDHWYISYGGTRKTYAFLNWLYEGSSVSLRRKFDKYKLYKQFLSRT